MTAVLAAPPVTRSRPWTAVFAVMFLSTWAGNQFSPLLLLYQERQHYSTTAVNAFLGVYVLGLVPAFLISGALSDRYGRRPVMLAGVIAAVATSAVLTVGELGPAAICLGRFLAGLAVGTATCVGTSWLKELSQPPYDLRADESAGARRAALSFSLGSATGAVVAGLIAQWGPWPEQLPFLIHVALTVPFAWLLRRAPETVPATRATGNGRARGRAREEPGEKARGKVREETGEEARGRAREEVGEGAPEEARATAVWRERRFTRVVVVAAPWIFASAAIGYGYLPVLLAPATGGLGIAYATLLTAVALGASALVQPWAKRLDRVDSARGLLTGLILITVGIVLVALAAGLLSWPLGIVAAFVAGGGMGTAMVSGVLEVQRIAPPADLAGLTGVFYAIAYSGFLLPTVLSAVATSSSIPVPVLLLVFAGFALLSTLHLVRVSRHHLPSR
ncbi:MFS transporter [Actinoplanes sp. NPDC051851]|uniref:MFS transporter n=1 Tax=Actinoplanes sp. NPDC051851 TaxID=3154753 RepID=UPI003448C860